VTEVTGEPGLNGSVASIDQVIAALANSE